MSEQPPITDASDLELPVFESQPIVRHRQVSLEEWLDEMQPYYEHYRKLLAEGRAEPRRMPWEGTFEL